MLKNQTAFLSCFTFLAKLCNFRCDSESESREREKLNSVELIGFEGKRSVFFARETNTQTIKSTFGPTN